MADSPRASFQAHAEPCVAHLASGLQRGAQTPSAQASRALSTGACRAGSSGGAQASPAGAQLTGDGAADVSRAESPDGERASPAGGPASHANAADVGTAEGANLVPAGVAAERGPAAEGADAPLVAAARLWGAAECDDGARSSQLPDAAGTPGVADGTFSGAKCGLAPGVANGVASGAVNGPGRGQARRRKRVRVASRCRRALACCCGRGDDGSAASPAAEFGAAPSEPCDKVIFICGLSARGRTEFYQVRSPA